MPKKRTKYIPDRLFYKLWKETNNYISEKDYVNAFISFSSDTNIPFKRKYGIDIKDSISMLQEIYRNSKKSLKDIISDCGIKKADISNIFCIPIRTVEDWYNEKNKMPDYIKLMILRFFNQINIGNYIKLDSELLQKNYITRKYIKHDKKEDKNNTLNHNSDEYSDEYYDKEDEEFYSFLNNIHDDFNNIKDKETRTKLQDSIKVRQLLESTMYLDDIINKSKT